MRERYLVLEKYPYFCLCRDICRGKRIARWAEPPQRKYASLSKGHTEGESVCCREHIDRW
jgi:hypothetical protein